MSRSYGKCDDRGSSMDKYWHRSLRCRERECVHKEMLSEEYGDVVFPIVIEVSDPWSGDYGRSPCIKGFIREKFFTEIRNILNGYIHYSYGNENEDSEEMFLKCFNKIKKGLSHIDGYRYNYNYVWLKSKEIKKAIKAWEGDPINILYYLAHAGLIEKAVNIEYRKKNKK
jgi:hypothetical protein